MSSAGNPHVRRNVWTLGANDKTLEAYAHAVETMQKRDPNDPTSWAYQAAIHGTHASQSKPLWNHCQHATWFFLPWHRMFLHFFEQIVRAAIVGAGGPQDWALPFWDYDAGGQQATLPHAFRDPKVNGKDNPLYVAERDPGINAGNALSPAVTSAAQALSRPKFTGTAQFGGGVTGFAHFANRTGRLEWTPHNDVHSHVGGWMSDVDM